MFDKLWGTDIECVFEESVLRGSLLQGGEWMLLSWRNSHTHLCDSKMSLFCFLHEKIFKNSESLIYVICNLNFPVFETFLVRLIKFSFLQVFSMLWFMLYVSKVLAFISPLCVAWEAEAHRDFTCSLWSLFKLLCSCGMTSLLLGPLKSVRGGFSCPAQPHLSTLITIEAVTTISEHLGVGSKVFLTPDLGS